MIFKLGRAISYEYIFWRWRRRIDNILPTCEWSTSLMVRMLCCCSDQGDTVPICQYSPPIITQLIFAHNPSTAARCSYQRKQSFKLFRHLLLARDPLMGSGEVSWWSPDGFLITVKQGDTLYLLILIPTMTWMFNNRINLENMDISK